MASNLKVLFFSKLRMSCLLNERILLSNKLCMFIRKCIQVHGGAIIVVVATTYYCIQLTYVIGLRGGVLTLFEI